MPIFLDKYLYATVMLSFGFVSSVLITFLVVLSADTLDNGAHSNYSLPVVFGRLVHSVLSITYFSSYLPFFAVRGGTYSNKHHSSPLPVESSLTQWKKFVMSQGKFRMACIIGIVIWVAANQHLGNNLSTWIGLDITNAHGRLMVQL